MLVHIAHRRLQSRSKNGSRGSKCALQRVTGIAVLAVYLYLQNSIKPFLSLSFSSLAFSGPAFSALPKDVILPLLARLV